METESLYNLLQVPKEGGPPPEEELPQGEKKKYLPPTSRRDPKFEELQKVLMEWINTELLADHIVVRSLEEDMFDGLILHHLFQKLAGVKLEVEEIALTAPSQRRKLELVLGAADRRLQPGQVRWSVDAIFNKDLLATLHLLVALAKHFQPNLPLPANVQVEVITMERTKSGLKSEKSVEQLTGCRRGHASEGRLRRTPGAGSRESERCEGGHREFRQPEAGPSGPVCAESGHPVCRWGHLTPADWPTARLFPALEGVLPHSQLPRGNAAQRDLCPGAAEGRRPAHLPRQPRRHREQGHQEHAAGALQPVLQTQAEGKHGQGAPWVPELTSTARRAASSPRTGPAAAHPPPRPVSVSICLSASEHARRESISSRPLAPLSLFERVCCWEGSGEPAGGLRRTRQGA